MPLLCVFTSKQSPLRYEVVGENTNNGKRHQQWQILQAIKSIPCCFLYIPMNNILHLFLPLSAQLIYSGLYILHE
jgi:hypothetical protein